MNNTIYCREYSIQQFKKTKLFWFNYYIYDFMYTSIIIIIIFVIYFMIFMIIEKKKTIK